MTITSQKFSTIEELHKYQLKGFNIVSMNDPNLRTNKEGKRLPGTIIAMTRESTTTIGSIVRCCLPCIIAESSNESSCNNIYLRTEQHIFSLDSNKYPDLSTIKRELNGRLKDGPATPLLLRQQIEQPVTIN